MGLDIKNKGAWDVFREAKIEESVLEELDAREIDPQACPETPREIDAFYQANIGLLYRVVQPYRGLDNYDDLFQEASVGFMKAIQTYRADCGVKLSTYVFICAKNEVRMYLRKGAAKIRSASVVSLDADIDDDQKRKVIDTIFDSNCPIDKLENDLYAKSIFRIAMQIVDYEMSKEAGIVVHRTMDGITQSQIARELNVSQSKVSKLLSASRKQLKEKLNAAGFDGF